MILTVYEVTCNICEKEYHHRAGSLEIVQAGGWLVLFNADGSEATAAVCPECWRQIVECWKSKGDQ